MLWVMTTDTDRGPLDAETTPSAVERLRKAMAAIGTRDIAAIRASDIAGGPACADCGCNTVHGQTVMGRWVCRDTETCDNNRKAA